MNNASDFSALNLAYLGDAVFELCVRSRIMEDGNQQVDKLNKRARDIVRAESQAKMYHLLSGVLTEDELAAMKRGRNSHPKTMAKSASVSDYRHATGLESLFGYLYVSGKNERIRELFDICYGMIERIE